MGGGLVSRDFRGETKVKLLKTKDLTNDSV